VAPHGKSIALIQRRLVGDACGWADTALKAYENILTTLGLGWWIGFGGKWAGDRLTAQLSRTLDGIILRSIQIQNYFVQFAEI